MQDFQHSEEIGPQRHISIFELIDSMPNNYPLKASEAAFLSNVTDRMALTILHVLTVKGRLQARYVVHCPKCGLPAASVKETTDIGQSVFCHVCEDKFTPDSNYIETRYVKALPDTDQTNPSKKGDCENDENKRGCPIKCFG